MMTRLLEVVTCSRCGRRASPVLMYRSLDNGTWSCRNLHNCNRRKSGEDWR